MRLQKIIKRFKNFPIKPYIKLEKINDDIQNASSFTDELFKKRRIKIGIKFKF